MSSRLDLRVAKPERASGTGGIEIRAYGTQAEADANARDGGDACHHHGRIACAERGMRGLDRCVARLANSAGRERPPPGVNKKGRAPLANSRPPAPVQELVTERRH